MTRSTPPDISLVLPVYNAGAFLEKRLGLLCSYLLESGLRFEIIAVDDGSRDESASILLSCGFPEVRAVTHPTNRGKFAAIKTGMANAVGECCIFTDADVPYELGAIPYIHDLVFRGGFHVVVGDRTLPGAVYSSQLSILRRAATRYFTLFTRLFVTGGLHDTQCGIKGFRNDIAKALFPLVREDGFAGDVELLYISLKYNLAIRRIPARLQFQGPSTVSPLRDGITMMRTLARVRLNHQRKLYDCDTLAALARQDYWNFPRQRFADGRSRIGAG